jgi:hypothetical protein
MGRFPLFAGITLLSEKNTSGNRAAAKKTAPACRALPFQRRGM